MMMATGNVIDISSSSDSDADNVPLRRRMSERKRRLSDKAKETLKQQVNDVRILWDKLWLNQNDIEIQLYTLTTWSSW